MSVSDRVDVGRRPAQHGDRLRGRHATALRRSDDTEAAVDASHDEVVALDHDGLARLHDRALAARADRRQQRRPRAEVGPADVHRAHHDPTGLRAAPLHDRVVDRTRAAGSPRTPTSSSIGAPTIGRSVWSEPGEPPEGRRDRPRRHRKMPAFQATPGSFRSISARSLGRLLLEPIELVGASARRRPASSRASG